MYCENCGKELVSNTKFCIFCGAEQTANAILSAENPIPAQSEPITESAAACFSESSKTENSEPNETEHSAPNEATVPLPSEIAMAGAAQKSSSLFCNKSEGVLVFPEIEPIKNETNPPAPKYTLKHLVMCLATAAVMAITAGVFAGLYFASI